MSESVIVSCVDGLISILQEERDKVSLYSLVDMVSIALGDRVLVGDASRYIYHVARSLGYDIPPYPLAGCGEIKEFFADEGVANVPEWYEQRLGIEMAVYQHLHEKTIVVVEDWSGARKVLLLEGVCYRQDVGFARLTESGIALKIEARRLVDVLRFALVAARNAAAGPACMRETDMIGVKA